MAYKTPLPLSNFLLIAAALKINLKGLMNTEFEFKSYC